MFQALGDTQKTVSYVSQPSCLLLEVWLVVGVRGGGEKGGGKKGTSPYSKAVLDTLARVCLVSQGRLFYGDSL
jgi:hypothetical protein